MHFNAFGNLAHPAELARFLRTVRHLRPRQLAYGLRYRLLKTGKGAPLALEPRRLAFKCPGLDRSAQRTWDGAGAFRFQNEPGDFGGDWDQPRKSRLWRYHLHYMDWIHEIPAGREEWIDRWIRENPPEASGIGWEPYPLSRRLSSWCRHYASAGTAPSLEVLRSMGLQAGRLSGELEFHLDANHLLENLFALASVGLYRRHGDAATAAVLDRAMAALGREFSAQFLADGGHYELSPMYHSALTERTLDLLNAWPEEEDFHPGVRRLLLGRVPALLDWLDAMSVGGRFGLFNDAAYDMAPTADSLLAYGNRLLSRRPRAGRTLQSLAASGYHRAEAGGFTLIFDAGRPGPDHQLGHAHCDMLSFCLWHGDIPLIVHPGTYGYAPGEMREYCRATASHNTVTVDGSEQAELWGAHRIGRRGSPTLVSAREHGDGSIGMEAFHDAFAHLPGGPVHRRILHLDRGGIRIRDEIRSGREHSNRAFLHLSPDCRVAREGSALAVRLGGKVFSVRSERSLSLEQGWHCPEFGRRTPAPVITADFSAGPCEYELRLEENPGP